MVSARGGKGKVLPSSQATTLSRRSLPMARKSSSASLRAATY
ncbi:hypothetical protein MGSAQ_001871 [marine sediment metagenome]|uniref:Uncharacterized protein n=1 Tax=marine sediment metagenome TaxID=412755 RepID=A0A1B6NTF3_9ZZZZ